MIMYISADAKAHEEIKLECNTFVKASEAF